MKKSVLILLIASLLSFNLSTANPVSREVAREIAISWYANIAGSSVTDYSIEDEFSLTKDDLATLYVFNFKSGGFVIVAAEDASIPILGFSEEDPFPADLSCPAVRDWLEDYSMQIDQIRKEGLSNQETKWQWEVIRQGNFRKPADTIVVLPLLSTTWSQDCYYNEMCPVDPAGPCGHAVTGCVATAMAQIMKYHNFPPRGVGSYAYTHPNYGEQSADFGNTIYDWAAMPDNVTSANIPVATIMYHAGVAVNIIYGANGSDANLGDVIEAFVDYFNYQPGIEWHNQSEYPDPLDWKNLIRTDLDNQLPVWYGGAKNTSVGHAFVCDGYRTLFDEMFHFNWGWGGKYNGWYPIGALNTAYGNWNLNNHILTSIRPYNPELITRITRPVDNFVAHAGNSVEIVAATVYGNADHMKITIDGVTVANGPSNTISYTWDTQEGDLGSHDIKSWSYSGYDSVYYPINLNIADCWVTQASGFPASLKEIDYISAIDSNIAWAIAREKIGNWQVPCQAFTRTVDGGETWIAGNISDCDDLTFSMIQGVSSQKAYVAMYRFSGSAPQGIYVTTDYGNTWEHQASAVFSDASSWPICVHFFNENEGWCMGDPISSAEGFEMYTTNNGGANWIMVPAANMPPSIPAETSSWFGCFSAINDTVWFGTTLGRVFKSTDKGYTWTVTSVNGMAEENIIPVFQNGSHGLVFNLFGEPKLYETFDGGESWEMVNYSGPFFQTSLAFVPGTANTWISTGGGDQNPDAGASFSEDGGRTWTIFPGTKGVNFRNMAWVNTHCGWAGSYNYSSTEGGIFKFVGKFSSPSAINDDHLNPFEYSVYPNPASRQITIEMPTTPGKNTILTIYNLNGQQIIKRDITEPQTVMDVSGLLRGIYYVKVTNDKEVKAGKFVKK